jgi:glycolate oxidase FAD binding subunit
MNLAATFLSELSTRLGAAAVRQRTGSGWEVAGVRPLAVVAPESPDGVAEVLALCAAEGVPVEPAGAGTWLGRGAGRAKPGDAPLVLSTRRLSGVLEYEPADLVVGLAAGVPHSDLAVRLAAHRQVLPLDPPALPGATVGATLALGAAGPLRAGARTPRDMVLGVELATGDGRLLRFGGRVVKNVAGYDVTRLVAGSGGSLGVITSAYLLLRSAPEVDRTLFVPAGTLPAAAELALEVRDRTGPDALEVLSPGLADELGLGAEWCLLVRLRGTTASVADATARLAAVSRAAADAAAGTWERLSAAEAAASLYVRLSHHPSSLARTLASADGIGPAHAAAGAAAGGAAAEWRIAAHGTDGIVRLWRPAGVPAPAAAPVGEALKAAGAELASIGGTLTCAVLPAELEHLPRRYHAADAGALVLMERLRRSFDPAGVLLPGRQEARP